MIEAALGVEVEPNLRDESVSRVVLVPKGLYLLVLERFASLERKTMQSPNGEESPGFWAKNLGSHSVQVRTASRLSLQSQQEHVMPLDLEMPRVSARNSLRRAKIEILLVLVTEWQPEAAYSLLEHGRAVSKAAGCGSFHGSLIAALVVKSLDASRSASRIRRWSELSSVTPQHRSCARDGEAVCEHERENSLRVSVEAVWTAEGSVERLQHSVPG